MNIYLGLFAVSLIIGLTGQLLLKKGMNYLGEITLFSDGVLSFFKTIWAVFTNRTVLSGVFFFATSSLLWLIILSGLELSYIYPLVSLNYVLIAMGSRLFFKEQVTKMRWLSIIIIIMGVILVSSS